MKIIKIVAIITLILFSASWLISMFLGPDDLSKCGLTPTSQSGCQPADAIVAISGGDTSARTAEAVKLYKSGWAKKLVFSGAAMDKSGPSNAEAMSLIAQQSGVDPSDILIEESSNTTKENAVKTESVLTGNSIESIILVTSAYHQKRASIEFGKQSPNVNIRNHPTPNDSQWPPLWWTTPYGWILAFTELGKTAIAAIGASR